MNKYHVDKQKSSLLLVSIFVFVGGYNLPCGEKQKSSLLLVRHFVFGGVYNLPCGETKKSSLLYVRHFFFSLFKKQNVVLWVYFTLRPLFCEVSEEKSFGFVIQFTPGELSSWLLISGHIWLRHKTLHKIFLHYCAKRDFCPKSS